MAISNIASPLPTPTAGRRQPALRLEQALREGLLTRPGVLDELLAPETPPLEVAVEDLIRGPDPADGAPAVRGLRRHVARVTGLLRRAGPFAPPPRPDREAAERRLGIAIGTADAMGPEATPAAVLLRHVRLHLAIADALDAETALMGDLRADIAWGRHRLSEHRSLSDARFGPIECIDPLSDGRCRRMGYRVDGVVVALTYAGDRRVHQGAAWFALCSGPLHPLKASVDTWTRLRDALVTRPTPTDI